MVAADTAKFLTSLTFLDAGSVILTNPWNFVPEMEETKILLCCMNLYVSPTAVSPLLTGNVCVTGDVFDVAELALCTLNSSLCVSSLLECCQQKGAHQFPPRAV